MKGQEMDREKLCEDAARASFEYNGNLNWDTTTDQNRRLGRIQSVATIKAIEPHIRADERRKVLEAIDAAELDGLIYTYNPEGMPVYAEIVSKWLRSHLESTP